MALDDELARSRRRVVGVIKLVEELQVVRRLEHAPRPLLQRPQRQARQLRPQPLGLVQRVVLPLPTRPAAGSAR